MSTTRTKATNKRKTENTKSMMLSYTRQYAGKVGTKTGYLVKQGNIALCPNFYSIRVYHVTNIQNMKNNPSVTR